MGRLAPLARLVQVLEGGRGRKEESREGLKAVLRAQVVRAAADGDREKVLRKSKDLGFLTGFESQASLVAGRNGGPGFKRAFGGPRG